MKKCVDPSASRGEGDMIRADIIKRIDIYSKLE
jgi:hypothetical protein